MLYINYSTRLLLLIIQPITINLICENMTFTVELQTWSCDCSVCDYK